MNILIAGDLVPLNSNENLLINGDFKNYFSHFEDTFKTADLFIANLECPLTSNNEKLNKSGSSLKGKVETIIGIKKLGINLLSLANNHIGDYRDAGVLETLSILEENKISSVGAGVNLMDAKVPFIYEKDNTVVGVLSFADHEFGMGSKNSAGANTFNLINAYNDITALSEKVDYIIVLLHDGKEYYHYPSPELQKICRHLINIGADLVVCQHSHMIGAVEDFNTGKIIYGQGNFLFDYRKNYSTQWSYGFLIKIDIKKSDSNIEFIPFKQSYPGITKLSLEGENRFFNNLRESSEIAKNQEFIEKSWKDFTLKQKSNYFSAAFGHHIFLSKIFKITGLYKVIISNKVALIVLNFIRSRVHRESFITILEEQIKSK